MAMMATAELITAGGILGLIMLTFRIVFKRLEEKQDVAVCKALEDGTKEIIKRQEETIMKFDDSLRFFLTEVTRLIERSEMVAAKLEKMNGNT